MSQRRLLLLLTSLAILRPTDGWGQVLGPLPTAAQCQTAVAAVQAGNPTPVQVTTLAGCLVDRGPVLSAYLRSIRSSLDTARLSIAFGHAATVRDNTTFDAAREIAADPAASTVARVMSLWVLTNYEMPRGTTSTWQSISVGPYTSPCGPGLATSGQMLEGQTPLPGNHTAITVSLADALNADASAPDQVRSAASCLKGASREDWANLPAGVPPTIYPPVNTALITLVPVCGNTFTIRNANPLPITVQYDVTGTTETRQYGLPEKPASQSYSTTNFTTAHFGTVRVLFQGTVVATGTAPGASCTPGVTVFLHGTGNQGNPATKFINATAPTAPSPGKYQDSPSIEFNGGNVWKEVGTWTAPANITSGQLNALAPIHLWLTVKTTSDEGTRYDLRVEALKNGAVVVAGETYCIQGVTRNDVGALEALTAFGTFTPFSFNGTSDVLALKVKTRIGTNGSGVKCEGHANATGLRVWFDATGRPSKLDVSF